MNGAALNITLLAGIGTLSFVAGLFFLRFWFSSRDRLFIYFALSFWIEAGNRLLMALSRGAGEDSPVHFSIRLLSYLLILVAVWEKNRSRGR